MTQRNGRHTSAFLLLQLAESPAYGGMLIKKLEEELPCCFSDSAIIYRSLKDMESKDLVRTEWETRNSGSPVKWYYITQKGLEMLDLMADDIRKRHANLEHFLSKFNSLNKNSNNNDSNQ